MKIIVVPARVEDHLKINLTLSNLLPNVIFEPDGAFSIRHFGDLSQSSLQKYNLNNETVYRYYKAGYRLIANSEKEHRPALQTIAEAWGCEPSQLYVFDTDVLNISKHGKYLIDTVELITKTLPSIPKVKKRRT